MVEHEYPFASNSRRLSTKKRYVGSGNRIARMDPNEKENSKNPSLSLSLISRQHTIV
jgi:hypothetical protein